MGVVGTLNCSRALLYPTRLFDGSILATDLSGTTLGWRPTSSRCPRWSFASRYVGRVISHCWTVEGARVTPGRGGLCLSALFWGGVARTRPSKERIETPTFCPRTRWVSLTRLEASSSDMVGNAWICAVVNGVVLPCPVSCTRDASAPRALAWFVSSVCSSLTEIKIPSEINKVASKPSETSASRQRSGKGASKRRNEGNLCIPLSP